MQPLPATYNYSLVVLSYLVAALGSYAFLQFTSRIIDLRASTARFIWLGGGAIAMGGGVWAMHFVGMLAYRLPIPASYDPWTTVISMLPAVLAAGVALFVVASPVISLLRLLTGGVLMGAGIGAMHYTGMAAMHLNALVRYDPVLFGTSLVVAVILAILALQVTFWVGTFPAAGIAGSREILGALIMGFAVAAMHYTAMASTYCLAAPAEQNGGGSALDPSTFAIFVAFSTSLVLLIAINAVIFDRRVAMESSLRKAALDGQREVSEQLFQAQKMEAVGQLTGGVAHDFNNILMVIMSNVEALEEEENLDPQLRKRIESINAATGRAADLTRQLLAFSRKQALRPQHTRVNDLVTATGALLRRSLGEQVEIEAILADDLWDVFIDRAQLESALVNLCINARDAMPDGGRLMIETENATLDKDYAAQNTEVVAGDYVLLSVSDTGKGMLPDVLEKVFEPFFTTKGPGKGTGLGLSMVYGFIKQSKGHIKIYSEFGRGTSIKLYLPRSVDERATASATQNVPIPRGKESVLVVEDDAQVRAAVVGQVKSLGYTVAEAADGAAGLAAFESASQPFDLLLTDVVMPGAMNGKALADEVMRRWSRTRLVFMSGYTKNAIVHGGRLDEGVLLLSKPFQRKELAQILRLALDADATAS